MRCFVSFAALNYIHMCFLGPGECDIYYNYRSWDSISFADPPSKWWCIKARFLCVYHFIKKGTFKSWHKLCMSTYDFWNEDIKTPSSDLFTDMSVPPFILTQKMYAKVRISTTKKGVNKGLRLSWFSLSQGSFFWNFFWRAERNHRKYWAHRGSETWKNLDK